MESNLEIPSNADSLYPALFQCFTIILCGYIAGVLNLVSQSESKGIGTFVGTFALPSLIFLSLARLDFSTVNWTFLSAILFAKGVVFFAVIIVTIFVTKPTHLGRAGIFAIFCTQSNDFALGYPIINAIYSTTHPEYALYLYLMAPISLAILNPVAFVLMEINKLKEAMQSQPIDETQNKSPVSKLKVLRQIIKGIAFNPVLVMTILGIVGNVLFKHHLSVYIEGLLEVFGQAFSGTALFLLGLRMVGQVHRLRGPGLLLPCVLIMVKLFVLPLIMRESVSFVNAGANETDTLSLSTYAFLYGTIPTAPAVFVFSNSYQLEIDLMASSMVVCTLLSAPMMFLSAQLITISKDYAEQLRIFGFDLSIASLVGACWVLLVFVATKKYKRMPHRLTMCLLVSQILLGVSVVWGGRGGSGGAGGSGLNQLLQQALRVFASYSCLLWTAMLSVGLLLLESRGPCFVVTLWPVLGFVAWGAPAVMVAILWATKTDYGDLDARCVGAIRLCLLMFCLTVSVGCLIVYTRFRRRASQLAALSAAVAGEPHEPHEPHEESTLVDNAEPISHSQSLSINGVGSGSYGAILSSPSHSGRHDAAAACDNDIEDFTEGARECACPGSQRARCHSNPSGSCQYLDELDRAASTLGLLPPEQTRGRGGQLLKHTALIIFYNLGMFIGIAYTTWSMMTRDENGVYVEIQFLDAAAGLGAGLAAFLLFGLHPDELLVPAARLIKTRWFGSETVVLPSVEDLPFETKHVCDQFITHHLERCRAAIAKDTRWRMRSYSGVFRGSCLVGWLLGCGLAKDPHEALIYGRHLLDGRLIAHINNAHHFTNSPLLYTFKKYLNRTNSLRPTEL